MDNKTIRFIDSEYRELFVIPDGANINIIYSPGDDRGTLTCKCEFLDPTHTKIGSNVYHICEFAERMKAIGARYEPELQLQEPVITPFTSGEEKYYTYNREENNTCIGHIAGDFGNDGERFYSTWQGRENDRNTSEFQGELHSAIYALRHGLLKDYASMEEYCRKHSEAKLQSGEHYVLYGFKMETGSRQYYTQCFFGEYKQDARFIIYSYDKKAPEMVSSFQIIKRIPVGDKVYVLGHSPQAVQPFATWQSYADKSKGYDWGHFWSNRKIAEKDLRCRAEAERTGKHYDYTKLQKQQKNHKDAR